MKWVFSHPRENVRNGAVKLLQCGVLPGGAAGCAEVWGIIGHKGDGGWPNSCSWSPASRNSLISPTPRAARGAVLTARPIVGAGNNHLEVLLSSVALGVLDTPTSSFSSYSSSGLAAGVLGWRGVVNASLTTGQVQQNVHKGEAEKKQENLDHTFGPVIWYRRVRNAIFSRTFQNSWSQVLLHQNKLSGLSVNKERNKQFPEQLFNEIYFGAKSMNEKTQSERNICKVWVTLEYLSQKEK